MYIFLFDIVYIHKHTCIHETDMHIHLHAAHSHSALSPSPFPHPTCLTPVTWHSSPHGARLPAHADFCLGIHCRNHFLLLFVCTLHVRWRAHAMPVRGSWLARAAHRRFLAWLHACHAFPRTLHTYSFVGMRHEPARFMPFWFLQNIHGHNSIPDTCGGWLPCMPATWHFSPYHHSMLFSKRARYLHARLPVCVGLSLCVPHRLFVHCGQRLVTR